MYYVPNLQSIFNTKLRFEVLLLSHSEKNTQRGFLTLMVAVMANTASENAVSRFDMVPVEQMSKTDERSGGIDSAAVGTPPHVVCRPHEFITLVCSLRSALT